MAKVPSVLLPVLMMATAYAQTATEAPAEKASPLTVIIFLVLFFGSCVGYFGYVWWNQKRSRQPGEGKEPR